MSDTSRGTPQTADRRPSVRPDDCTWVFTGHDGLEGIDAFLNKRVPRFG